MRKAVSGTSRANYIIFGLIVLAALVVLAAGCGSGDVTSTTPTTASSDSVSPTQETTGGTQQTTKTSTITSEERVTVGGKTPEEYAAELPELQKAVEADPENLEALQELAIAQYNSGDYEAAAATYEKMLGISDDAFTRNNYANVLRDWGKKAEAKAEYEKAMAADETLVTAYINLASMYVSEQNIDQAITIVDRGLAAVQGEDRTRLEDYKNQLIEKKAEE